MPSPFPGMDPWLEHFWSDVHSRLIIYISNQLQRALPAPLVARAEETVLIDAPGMKPRFVRPDDVVVEIEEDPKIPDYQPSFLPWKDDPGGVAVATQPTLKPIILTTTAPPITDRHVEVIDSTTEDRVVTVIEVMSPTNKRPGPARLAYLNKVGAFILGGVNVVEIDLVRQGEWSFSISEVAAPVPRPPYMACVFRVPNWHEREYYPLPMRERLPAIAIPLRRTDRDVALDLQALIDEVYDTGSYDRINYARPVQPPLSTDDTAWAETILKTGRKRTI